MGLTVATVDYNYIALTMQRAVMIRPLQVCTPVRGQGLSGPVRHVRKRRQRAALKLAQGCIIHSLLGPLVTSGSED